MKRHPFVILMIVLFGVLTIIFYSAGNIPGVFFNGLICLLLLFPETDSESNSGSDSESDTE